MPKGVIVTDNKRFDICLGVSEYGLGDTPIWLTMLNAEKMFSGAGCSYCYIKPSSAVEELKKAKECPAGYHKHKVGTYSYCHPSGRKHAGGEDQKAHEDAGKQGEHKEKTQKGHKEESFVVDEDEIKSVVVSAVNDKKNKKAFDIEDEDLDTRKKVVWDIFEKALGDDYIKCVWASERAFSDWKGWPSSTGGLLFRLGVGIAVGKEAEADEEIKKIVSKNYSGQVATRMSMLDEMKEESLKHFVSSIRLNATLAQEVIKKKTGKKDKITVYRAVTNRDMLTGAKEGDVVDINNGIVSSWTLSREFAERRARSFTTRMVSQEIPISSILYSDRANYSGVASLLREDEVVFHANNQKARLESVYEYGGRRIEETKKALDVEESNAVVNLDIDDINWLKDEKKEEEIEKGPPGPPPRPGLEWKEETKRWIRPEEAQVTEAGSKEDKAISSIPKGQHTDEFLHFYALAKRTGSDVALRRAENQASDLIEMASNKAFPEERRNLLSDEQRTMLADWLMRDVRYPAAVLDRIDKNSIMGILRRVQATDGEFARTGVPDYYSYTMKQMIGYWITSNKQGNKQAAIDMFSLMQTYIDIASPEARVDDRRLGAVVNNVTGYLEKYFDSKKEFMESTSDEDERWVRERRKIIRSFKKNVYDPMVKAYDRPTMIMALDKFMQFQHQVEPTAVPQTFGMDYSVSMNAEIIKPILNYLAKEDTKKSFDDVRKVNRVSMGLIKAELFVDGVDLTKMAPGPPPRPGLQWKEETHRWIRPAREGAPVPEESRLRIDNWKAKQEKTKSFLYHDANFYYKKMTGGDFEDRLDGMREKGIRTDGVLINYVTREINDKIGRPVGIYARPYEDYKKDIMKMETAVFIKVDDEITKNAVVDDIYDLNMVWSQGGTWEDVLKMRLDEYNKGDFDGAEVLITKDISPDRLIFGVDLLASAFDQSGRSEWDKAVCIEGGKCDKYGVPWAYYSEGLRWEEREKELGKYGGKWEIFNKAFEILEQSLEKQNGVKLLVLQSPPMLEGEEQHDLEKEIERPISPAIAPYISQKIIDMDPDKPEWRKDMVEGPNAPYMRPKRVLNLDEGVIEVIVKSFDNKPFEPRLSTALTMVNRPDMVDGPPEAWKPEGRGFSVQVTTFDWWPKVQLGDRREFYVTNASEEAVNGLYKMTRVDDKYWRIHKEDFDSMESSEDVIKSIESAYYYEV